MKAKLLFCRCCYGYLVSGMSVLVIGAILPSLIREAGISYAVAGGLLSIMAIGNFLASVIFPMGVAFWGKHISVTVISAMVPICFFILLFLPPIAVMYLLMFLCGIAKGSITIINNETVNDISDYPTKMLNFLHCSYAAGAFIAPFLTAMCLFFNLSWRFVICILIVFNITACLSYSKALFPDKSSGSQGKESSAVPLKKAEKRYLKSPDFYCIGIIMFFYLGVENCINGWFVTYLQSTGIISEVFAASLVSITWAVIMAGRLFCGAISNKFKKGTIIFMDCAGAAFFFFLLITATTLPVITIALIGLGFCLSSIFPTCVANAGIFIQGSTSGMSLLTAISALGGIITPQIVGSVADRMGMVQAVSFLSVNVMLMIGLSLINLKRQNRYT